VCGVVSGVIKELLFASSGHEPVKCGYVFSLRVHPDYRYITELVSMSSAPTSAEAT
jgi:hypothetical protein